MQRKRLVAGLAASLMAASGLAVTTHGSASAHRTRFDVVGPAKLMAKEKKVLGRTITATGKGLLNVNVEAFLDGKTDKEPTASALSYDYTGPEGLHRPGAFALRNLTKGTYTIVLSRKGYVSQTIEDVTVDGSTPRAYLGEIEMDKPSPCKVTLQVPGKAKEGHKVTADVKVKAKQGTAVGKVKLLVDGKKAGSDTLTKKDHGKLSFVLKDLVAGKHKLVASYAGSDTVAAADSGKETITVKGKKKGH